MNLPAFKFPKPLGRALSMLPTYPPSVLFSHSLNLALRRIIKPELLQPLHGKLVNIRVLDVGISLYFTIDSSGFVACKADRKPDLAISATAHDFFLLGTRREDPDTLFFSRRLVVEGETELGLLAKNTLDAIEMPKLGLSRFTPEKVLEKFALRLHAASR